MSVEVESEEINKKRKSILEFILLNHPLDCPICEKAGRCDLQKFTKEYGLSKGRYRESKRGGGKSSIKLLRTHIDRCIHCTRCTRYKEKVLGEQDWGFMGRGTKMLLTESLEGQQVHRDKKCKQYVNAKGDQTLRGNLTDICPVGALLHNKVKSDPRAWNLEMRRSLAGPSLTPVILEEYKSQVIRVLPGYAGQWITDEERWGKTEVGECVEAKRMRQGVANELRSKRITLTEWLKKERSPLQLAFNREGRKEVKKVQGTYMDSEGKMTRLPRDGVSDGYAEVYKEMKEGRNPYVSEKEEGRDKESKDTNKGSNARTESESSAIEREVDGCKPSSIENDPTRSIEIKNDLTKTRRWHL